MEIIKYIIIHKTLSRIYSHFMCSFQIFLMIGENSHYKILSEKNIQKHTNHCMHEDLF